MRNEAYEGENDDRHRWQFAIFHFHQLSHHFRGHTPCVTLFVPVQNILFAIAEQALNIVIILVYFSYNTSISHFTSIIPLTVKTRGRINQVSTSSLKQHK